MSQAAPGENRRAALRPARVFYCYARKDAEFLRELQAHLVPLARSGVIADSPPHAALPDDDYPSRGKVDLERADLAVVLVSADLFASKSCFEGHVEPALERSAQDRIWIIPVLVRHCQWRNTTLGRLQCIPSDGQPVVSWPNRDLAWLSVVQSIQAVAEELQARPDWNARGHDSIGAEPGSTAAAAQRLLEQVPQPRPTPSPGGLRRFTEAVLAQETDFAAFCFDHFPEVQSRLLNGMDWRQKIRVLLDLVRRDDAEQTLIAALGQDFPKAYQRHRLLLES